MGLKHKMRWKGQDDPNYSDDDLKQYLKNKMKQQCPFNIDSTSKLFFPYSKICSNNATFAWIVKTKDKGRKNISSQASHLERGFKHTCLNCTATAWLS